MELPLNEHDRRDHAKLYVSSHDISFARGCALHIQKKDWFRQPWSRGTLYFQQSVYVTSMIVSYARPFTPGRGGLHFPKRLIPYDSEQMKLHRDLLDRRNKIHAHSDLDKWSIRPWRMGDIETAIVSQPWLIVQKTEVAMFLTMTDALLAKISGREEEILAKYR